MSKSDYSSMVVRALGKRNTKKKQKTEGKWARPPDEEAFAAIYSELLRKGVVEDLRALSSLELPYRDGYPEMYESLLDLLEPKVRMAFAQMEELDDGTTPTLVDICSGAGMASLGFEEAGITPLLGIDVWKTATKAYSLNHPESISLQIGVDELYDLATQRGIEFPNADIVATGPPCQDDSRLNKARGDRCDMDRGRLKAPSLDVALLFDPRWIVMETVSKAYEAQLREAGATQVFELKDSELGGYTIRRRHFYVWTPPGAVLDITHYAEPGSWDQALRSIGIDVPPHTCFTIDSNALAYKNGKPKRWSDGIARRPGSPAHATTGQGSAYRIRVPVGDQDPLDPCYEFTEFDERRLTPEESSVIQGFPDLKLGDGTVRERATLLGNGWPRSFGYAIGDAIADAEGW